MIITIDGPSGTGKSTVAKELAKKLGFFHLDTGAMYRAFAWFLQKRKIAFSDKNEIGKALGKFSFSFKKFNDKYHYFVGEAEITELIRTEEIASFASKISALANVRKTLVKMQRQLANGRDIVCEGRDMGTVVFPQAEMKVFLTARAEIRAKRRWKELIEKNPQDENTFSWQEVLEKQTKRDEEDTTREVSPLRKAIDAIEVDTSDLTISEVVGTLIKRFHHKVKPFFGPAFLTPKKMDFFYRFVIFFVWIFFKTFYTFKLYGREHFLPGQAIVAANHASFFDPPIIAISSPEEINFLARKTLFDYPLLGKLIKALHSHPISGKGGDAAVFKKTIEILKKGKKILVFPEGSRSSDEEMKPLKEGIGFLAAKAEAPIIPVYIHGTFQIWNRYRKFPKLFGKMACVFGSPIYFHEFSQLSRKDIQKAIADCLHKKIFELRNWYLQGAKGSPP